MFINKYFSMAVTLAALTTVATGCSDSDNWTPGPDINPGCMTVYFGEMSSYNIIVEPDDSRIIPVTVGRAVTDMAANVSIIVDKCPEGAVVPESVSFEAGQQTATLYIDIENMPSKSRGEIAIKLPDDMTTPYGAGTSSLSLNINVSGAWLPVSEDALLSITNTSGDNLYPVMKTSLMVLDGTDNFKLTDFCGSGLDLVFTMSSPGNGWTYFKPVKNFIDAEVAYSAIGFGDYEFDGGWFLYDTKKAEYPCWSPDGVTYPEIDYLEFEDKLCYMQLISGDDNKGWMYMSPYIYFSDNTGSYVNINVDFTTIYTPFSGDSE